MHRSKFTFAPYWFVELVELCEQSGLPCAGHRLLTLTTMERAPRRALPLLSVEGVRRQQVPQAGPAPAPGPTPKRACDTAAL